MGVRIVRALAGAGAVWLLSAPAAPAAPPQMFRTDGYTAQISGSSPQVWYSLVLYQFQQTKPKEPAGYLLDVQRCFLEGGTTDCVSGVFTTGTAPVSVTGSGGGSWLTIRLANAPVGRWVCRPAPEDCVETPLDAPLNLDIVLRASGMSSTEPVIRSEYVGTYRDEYRSPDGSFASFTRHGSGSSFGPVRVEGDFLGLPLPLFNAESTTGTIGVTRETTLYVDRSPRGPK